MDLGHPLSSKPQDTPCLTGTGWHQSTQLTAVLLFGMSLQHLPLPLLPAQPRWPQEEDECFGEAGITPLGPTGLFIMFCKCLRVVVCYLSFSTAWISLLSKQFSNRCWDVFPTWSKALALPTHATKPGKSRTPNQTLMWPPQHSRMLPQEGFS